MKKNKQKIITMFLSVLLLITLFPFSAYANSTFIECPIVVSTLSGDSNYINIVESNGSIIGYTSDNKAIKACGISYFDGCPDTFYVYVWSNWSYSYLTEYLTSFTRYANLRMCIHIEGATTLAINRTFNTNSSDTQINSTYGFIGNVDSYGGPTISGGTPLCSSFSNSSDACVALDAYINSSSAPRYPFTLQNGYLFVYDLGSSGSMYSFDLSSISMEYSNIGSDPFPDTNQSYWFSSSLPEMDETTIPDSSATIIHWDKGSNINIYGQTQEMVANISGTSSGRYLYIYNPPVHFKWSGSSNPTASETVNYPMTINGVSDNDNWYIYDSVARLADFNQGGKVVGTVNSEPITGSVTSSGSIVLTTSEGSIYVQNSGGSTDISGANGGSIAENIKGLIETLNQFVSDVVQLLTVPISHIQQLIEASHDFLSEFSHFFDWLPPQVSGFVISAFVVMIAVGIFKLFL